MAKNNCDGKGRPLRQQGKGQQGKRTTCWSASLHVRPSWEALHLFSIASLFSSGSPGIHLVREQHYGFFIIVPHHVDQWEQDGFGVDEPQLVCDLANCMLLVCSSFPDIPQLHQSGMQILESHMELYVANMPLFLHGKNHQVCAVALGSSAQPCTTGNHC